MTNRKLEVLKELQQIPGVGRSISLDLWNLGIRSISGLKNQDPEQMYAKHCRQRGMPVDRCLLYTFRCAVYFASKKQHDPELLKWWNWKD
jgi:nucleotidyltransferase/DNA polymerase involved in DNA repair